MRRRSLIELEPASASTVKRETKIDKFIRSRLQRNDASVNFSNLLSTSEMCSKLCFEK